MSLNLSMRKSRIFLVTISMLRYAVTPFTTAVVLYVLLHNKGNGALLFFTQTYLLIQATGIVISFGSRDYLIKLFSKNVSMIKQNFNSAFSAKLILLIISIPILFIAVAQPLQSIIIITIVFFRFINSSMEPLINFNKTFSYAAAADSIFGVLFLLLLLFVDANSSSKILILSLWLSADFIRTFFLSIKHKQYFSLYFNSDVFLFYKSALPFFVTALAGLLFTRLDLYSLSWSAYSYQAGRYNILISFLQSIALFFSLILSPYSKNLFRISNTSYTKVANLFLVFSCIALIPIIVMLYFILKHGYHFELTIGELVLCYIDVAAFIFLLTRHYQFNRDNKQWLTAQLMLISCVIMYAMCWYLIPLYGWQGALLSAAVAQWMFYILASWLLNKRVKF